MPEPRPSKAAPWPAPSPWALYEGKGTSIIGNAIQSCGHIYITARAICSRSAYHSPRSASLAPSQLVSSRTVFWIPPWLPLLVMLRLPLPRVLRFPLSFTLRLPLPLAAVSALPRRARRSWRPSPLRLSTSTRAICFMTAQSRCSTPQVGQHGWCCCRAPVQAPSMGDASRGDASIDDARRFSQDGSSLGEPELGSVVGGRAGSRRSLTKRGTSGKVAQRNTVVNSARLYKPLISNYQKEVTRDV